MVNYQQYICLGAHCKCMNRDGKCENYHNGDHTCPHSVKTATPTLHSSEWLDELLDVLFPHEVPVKHVDGAWVPAFVTKEEAKQAILKKFEEVQVEALRKIGEPKLGDIDIKPESYDDVVKAIQWYKNRIAGLLDSPHPQLDTDTNVGDKQEVRPQTKENE